MTWTLPPIGFIRDYFATAANVTTTLQPPPSTVTIDCPRPPEQIAIDGRTTDSGLVPQTFTGHADFPIADAVAAIPSGGFPDFTDGEFRFAIDLSAVSTIGNTEGGYTACRTPPDSLESSQLTDFSDGHSHGDLDSGLQIVQYDTGAPISGSSTDDEFGFTLGGRLVNPSPSWPVPDAYAANTSGSTLWTLSELGTAAAGIDWEAYWTSSTSADISMRVIIVAYWLSGPLPQGFMCIV